jgi:Fic family protein
MNHGLEGLRGGFPLSLRLLCEIHKILLVNGRGSEKQPGEFRCSQHLQRSPIVSIPRTAQQIGVSAPTVAKSMEHMRQLGILREITGRERHRLFVYEPYLAILNEGTEPIR